MRTLCRQTRRKMRLFLDEIRRACRCLRGKPWLSIFWWIVSGGIIITRYLLWRNGGNDRSVTPGKSGTPEEESGCKGVLVDPADKSCDTNQVSLKSCSPSESGTPEEDDDEFQSGEYQVDPTDELYCGYDSTWETKQSQDTPQKRRNTGSSNYKHFKFNRFTNAAKDMYNYRHDYPQQNRAYRKNQQSTDEKPNLNFYLGKEPCSPDGVYISEIHKCWWGDYSKLESVHTYIQWLFPLQEPGMNYQASTLTKPEILDFLQNTQAKQNLLKSYKLMLDFYGIELEDERTGAVKRASNWKDRFYNLNSRTHNNLRITRILKCLGTLGYHHYQAPLVHFFLEETLVHGELPDVKESVLNYFLFAVLDKKQRRELVKFAYTNYSPKEEFVWCPKTIQEVWSWTQDEASGVAPDHDAEARNNEHNRLTGENDEDNEELM